MEKPLIILGAGDRGKTVAEIFTARQVTIYCFLDDDEKLLNTEFAGISVSGDTEDENYLKIIGDDCEVFVAEPVNFRRKELTEMLLKKRKKMPVNTIHDRASLEDSAFLGHGNFIAAGVSVGSGAFVRNHCAIEAGAIIDCRAEVEDFAQIGTRAVIGAGAKIGSEAVIGAGAVISPGINIGAGASVGPASLVVANVPENQTVFGVPAKKI